MKAIDVIQEVEKYVDLDEALMLSPVSIKRSGGGDWVLTNETTKEQLDSFSDMGEMTVFLRTIGAAAIPEGVLSQSEVNVEIPCEAIRMERLKGQGWDFRG